MITTLVLTAKWRGAFIFVLASLTGGFCLGQLQAAEKAHLSPLVQAKTLLTSGQYQEATAVLQKAVRDYQRQGNKPDHVAALVALGTTLQSLGQGCSAAQALEAARPLAKALGEPKLVMQAEAGLGNVYLYSRRLEAAEELLRSARDRARLLKDRRAEATTLQSLANVLVAKVAPPDRAYQKDARGVIVVVPSGATNASDYSEALGLYRESIRMAEASGDEILRLKILANEGRALQLHGDDKAAETLCQQAWGPVAKLPDPREKAFLSLAFGNLAAQLAPRLADKRELLLRQAGEAYQASLSVAAELKDDRTETFACGFLGELSFEAGRLADARQFGERALFLAQKSGNEEARFQWLWLLGRIFRAQGDSERALSAYRMAVRSLDSLRSDFSLWASVRGVGHSFRESYGRVYFELADLLLAKAAQKDSVEAAREDLLEARSTVEMLKSVEVEDYFFEDDCANLLRTRVQTVEASATNSAVVYFIPLTNRTELLLSLPTGLRRLSAAVGSDELTTEILRWRSQLERPGSDAHLAPAKKLWDWLIRPMEAVLQAEKVETLIFVPDRALRTVPMAALYDGDRFLIERFAVAISPGLSLMEAGRTPRRQMNMLVCGLSQAVQGFPALDFVPMELTNITANFTNRLLLNEAFSSASFAREMERGQFTAIHLASHGEFGSDVSKTFILTYDGKLTLDRLEQLILPSMLSDKPIELLTLSACQTAAGDDRAALGLAGVAVKSGARSALATLWYVSDQATELVMTAFYRNLKNEETISKAEALRRAQCSLVHDPQLSHPCFWAPYLLIGNWR